MTNQGRTYCVDTSSLIHLHRDYPRKVFASLWDGCERLIEDGRFFSPREVFRELEKKDDEILRWAKDSWSIFVEPDEGQLRLVASIMYDSAGLVDAAKETPEADPFVIALAWSRRTNLLKTDCHVVTEETWAGLGGIKIPNVCAQYDIPCIRLVQVFELEGWVF